MKKSILLLGAIFILAVCGFCYTNVNKTVKAEDTPTVEITNYNLAFQDTIYIMYAVETNVQDVENIKILAWKTSQLEYTKGTEDSVLKYYKTEDVGGKDKPVFVYTKLTLKEMTEYVYARPYYTKNGQDYYGETVKYSILEYAVDRLNNSTDEEFKDIVAEMLVFGTKIQTYNNYNLGRLPTDEYFNVEVTNGKLEDGFSSGLFTKTEETKLIADSEKDVMVSWYTTKGELVNQHQIPAETITEQYTVSLNVVDKKYLYKYNGEGYTVTGFSDKKDANVIIPSIHDGLPVTSIGFEAFHSCHEITSVTIGNNVTSIEDSAFSNCHGITSVTIGSSVTSIGFEAFSSCYDLTSITIPDSITSIGIRAFVYCNNLSYNEWDNALYLGNSEHHYLVLMTAKDTSKTSCEISKETKVIYYRAFSGYKELSSIEIPNSVISIEDSAFDMCSGLESITIGSSVTSIGNEAFAYCSGLKSITIGSSVTSIGEGAFEFCNDLSYNVYDNALYLGNSENPYLVLVGAKNNSITSCDINEKTKIIYSKAFSNCSGLTSITIPNGVTQIGNYAFQGCSGLNSITIPNSVTSIGKWAFQGCFGLTSVTIGNGVTQIGDYAFNDCSELTSIEIPNSVTQIGNYAFQNCSSLTSIEIPNSVTQIGKWAFFGCSGLTSVTIGNGVTQIGDNAFFGCSGLTSITIGSSVTQIGNNAFNNCYRLNSITIPNSVTQIGDYAFFGCYGLTSVTIGNGVTQIGDYAFTGCSELTSIEIPNSVTQIEDCAFSSCSGLTSITFDGTVAQWNAITKGDRWNDNVPATEVICKDGNVGL